MPAQTHGRVYNGFDIYTRKTKFAQAGCPTDKKGYRQRRRPSRNSSTGLVDHWIPCGGQKRLCCGTPLQPFSMFNNVSGQGRRRVPTGNSGRKFASTVTIGRSWAAKRAIGRRVANCQVKKPLLDGSKRQLKCCCLLPSRSSWEGIRSCGCGTGPTETEPTQISDPNLFTIIISDPTLWRPPAPGGGIGVPMYDTPYTFYPWLLELVQNAQRFVIMCNVYNYMLGTYDIFDATFLAALQRGVKITFVTIHPVWPPPTFAKYVGAGLSLITLTRPRYGVGGGEQVFHDKIYASEKAAYVGGQNATPWPPIDIGVAIKAPCPLYYDLIAKANYLATSMMHPVVFSHTAVSPWNYRGDEYFISISPYYPTCVGKPRCGKSTGSPPPFCHILSCPCVVQTSPVTSSVGCNFPLAACDSLSRPSTGPITPAGLGLKSAGGNVSYEWHHIYEIFTKARDFIKITNFLFNPWGGQWNSTGSAWTLFTELENAVRRGVVVDVWVSSIPPSEPGVNVGPPGGLCGFGPDCSAFRCKESREWFDRMYKYPNFRMHWWYQRPYFSLENAAATDAGPCFMLHGKLVFADSGLQITSMNFAPNYFACGATETGLSVRFSDTPPQWVLDGVGRYFAVIEKERTGVGTGGHYVCDNGAVENFQQVAVNGDKLCNTEGPLIDQYCTGSCLPAPEPLGNCAFSEN